MPSLIYAGLNFACISLALILPPFLGAPPDYVVLVGAFTVGMQAGQSTVVQTDTKRLPFGVHFRWVAVAVLVLGAICTLDFAPFGGLVLASLLTVAGAVAGLGIGRDAALVLSARGARAYQRRVANRSFGLLVSATAGAFATNLEFLVFILIFLLFFIYASRRISGHEPLVGKKIYWVVLLGLAGSLFYRNDVTWFRAAVADSSMFEIWNIYLVIYSGIQAVVGIAVVHIIFSDRLRWRTFRDSRLGFINIVAICLMLVSLVFGMVAFTWGGGFILSAALSLVLVAMTGIVSGFAHVWGRSWVPYVAGTAGTLVLLVGLTTGDQPGKWLVLANSATLFLALSGLLSQRRRS